MKYDFVVPCLMGTESLAADELRYHGFGDVETENGRVVFVGDMAECARANILLRCGERVLLRLASFEARTFEELFQGVRAIAWEDLIGRDDAFPVKGYSLESQLHSVPACQSIVKKAVVERLKEHHGVQWLEESGDRYQIQFALNRDRAEIFLDTSGEPLYKRGYKQQSNIATIRETLAASMVKLARYRGREDFIDPFCGSGTIAIEAAMASLNIMPGIRRSFDCEQWGFYDVRVFDDLREEYREGERREKLPIVAVDIDPECVAITKENARRAGVGDCIEVRRGDALKLEYPAERATLITNPPYGQRMLDVEQARGLYRGLGKRTAKLEGLKKYIITSDPQFETCFGRKADKKRKLYNGMIRCDLYMYFKSSGR
ncbi:MAG: class I SAM-dependent RNA methyltransferase [Ruminococcaceae bacterium]|nr:class I SAM-dependent RNA methyltransferase [Oscillospiraceae bacterium]